MLATFQVAGTFTYITEIPANDFVYITVVAKMFTRKGLVDNTFTNIVVVGANVKFVKNSIDPGDNIFVSGRIKAGRKGKKPIDTYYFMADSIHLIRRSAKNEIKRIAAAGEPQATETDVYDNYQGEPVK